MSVIPDSIEPIEGWKTWTLRDGKLTSPQVHLGWEPEKPAQAACPTNHPSVWKWIPRKGRNDPDPPAPQSSAPVPWMTTSVVFTFHPTVPAPTPDIVLPSGYYWSWEEVAGDHETIPHQSCSCGIHIAKEIGVATGYGVILGKVKGWGTTIDHAFGYRCEYAYPSELYAATEEEAKILSAYGVPVVMVGDMPEGEAKDFTEERLSRPREKSRTEEILDRAWSFMPAVIAALVVLYAILIMINPDPGSIAAVTFSALVCGFMWGTWFASR